MTSPDIQTIRTALTNTLRGLSTGPRRNQADALVSPDELRVALLALVSVEHALGATSTADVEPSVLGDQPALTVASSLATAAFETYWDTVMPSRWMEDNLYGSRQRHLATLKQELAALGYDMELKLENLGLGTSGTVRSNPTTARTHAREDPEPVSQPAEEMVPGD